MPSSLQSYADVWLHTAGVEWRAKWHVGDTPMVGNAMVNGADSSHASNSGACEKVCDMFVLHTR